jgi:hypothetical protein
MDLVTFIFVAKSPKRVFESVIQIPEFNYFKLKLNSCKGSFTKSKYSFTNMENI